LATGSAAAIEFWFDFNSPYAFFAARTVEAVAARHGRHVLWRPFLLGVVMKATGMEPLAGTPLRGDYARHDWARLARHAGIPFSLPMDHPSVALPATRAFYWIEATSADAAAAFARRAFDGYFGEHRQMSRPEVVAEVAAECGVERDALLAGIATPAIKEKVRSITDEALARGIFGSPFFLADSEPFWGHDRLPMLEEWLSRGGW
jgi:2-hydroxychromene-2-carboxylate isomerase